MVVVRSFLSESVNTHLSFAVPRTSPVDPTWSVAVSKTNVPYLVVVSVDMTEWALSNHNTGIVAVVVVGTYIPPWMPCRLVHCCVPNESEATPKKKEAKASKQASNRYCTFT